MAKLTRLLLIFLAIILFSSITQAVTVDDEINSIVMYAEQYEMGRITYLQVKVHSAEIREEINEILGAKEIIASGKMMPKVLSMEDAEKYFGKPTEMTKWVHEFDGHREIKLDKALPRWEKIVFDGKKIRVVFNAWPMIFKQGDEATQFYWTDFETRFKKDFDFDVKSMIAEIKSLAQNFVDTKSGAEELAKKMSRYRQILQMYLEQNKETCLKVVQEFFNEDEKQKEQKMLKWRVEAYSGENFDFFIEVRMCDDCEWPWIDVWFDIKGGPGFEPEKGTPKFKTVEGEKFFELSVEELNALLGEALDEAVGAAKNKKLYEVGMAMGKIRMINDILSEKLYHKESERFENFEKRKAFWRDRLSKYGRIEEEPLKEVRFEKRLVEVTEEQKEGWCREEREQCGKDEGCVDGKCVFALGGNEICENGKDDDGDKVVDCQDPDCAKQCGWACREICEKECWPCSNKYCRDVCGECWGCRGEECKSVCEKECWPCTETNCRSKPFCKECVACEESRGEVEECQKECHPCKQCVQEKSPEECEKQCEECTICKTGAVDQKCIAFCEKIEDRVQVNPCKELCKQNVVFYCNGVKQTYPCPYTYICDGVGQQIPCTIHECEGRKQNVPCGQEAGCGENQLQVEGECKCRAGFYDCDSDGKSCESAVKCHEGMEVCNNKKDDDNDYLVDCEDLMDCKYLSVCGEGQVCSGGKCLKLSDINVSCPPNQIFIEEKCVWNITCPPDWKVNEAGECVITCPSGFQAPNDTCVEIPINITCPPNNYINEFGKCVPIVCPANFTLIDGACVPTVPINVSCPDGYILKDNECVPIITQCPDGYELTDNECIPIAVNVTCPDGFVLDEENKCVPIKTCEEGYYLNENGECIPKIVNATTCPDGYQLRGNECVPLPVCPINHLYINEECVPAVTECPKGFVLKDGKCVPEIRECPEGTDLVDGKCVPVAIECPENFLFADGKCTPITCPAGEQLFEGECVPAAQETGEDCEIVDDCSGGNDVCSREKCKELRLEEKGALEEVPEEEILPEKPEEKAEAEKEGEYLPEKPPEELNIEEPMEQAEETITGAISWVTSLFFGNPKDCEKDENCNQNQHCERFIKKCFCKEGFFDCNGMGEGTDDDGCESKDPTCGGMRETCPKNCEMPNMYCDEKLRRCECKTEFFNCNGDWFDGCESDKECKGCKEDSECAKPRCEEHNNIVIKFKCLIGEGWVKEKGAVSFSGGCNFKPTGKTEAYLGFDAWGEAFGEIQRMSEMMEREGGWCKFELENLKKERNELEKSMNQEFLVWFFEKYVNEEPEEWETHIGGIFDTYWKFVDNSMRTAELTKCAGEGWPTEYTPIQLLEYESDAGHLKFWEEKKFIKQFNTEMISPYMQVWIFPPKEFLKHKLREAKETGIMPGPPEKGGKAGPSPEEIAEIRSNKEVMEKIRSISEEFGGSADMLITISDETEDLLNIVVTINPEVIVDVKPVKTPPPEVDVTISVEFDFFYDLISSIEKRMEVENPPWDREPRIKEFIDNAVIAGKILSKVSLATLTGDVKIKPLSSIPKVLGMMKLIMKQGSSEESQPMMEEGLEKGGPTIKESN